MVTPRSTRCSSASIWVGSSLPSAMVTTTIGAWAWSNPQRSAWAGPGSYWFNVGTSRSSLRATFSRCGLVVSSSES